MYAAIQTSIINYLTQQLPPSVLNPSWIYNYEPTKPGGYPAISVTAFSGDGKFIDTQRTRRNYILRIRCYQERSTVGSQSPNLVPEQEAERILIALVDQIMVLLDGYNAYKLDNTVPGLIYVDPVPQEWGYTGAPNPNIRTADIKLNAVVVQ